MGIGSDPFLGLPDCEVTPAMSDREALGTIPGLEIREKIGSGGMGSVYKAYQIALDRPVEPWGATFEDGYRAAVISEAIVESSTSGKEVAIEYGPPP